MYRIEKCANTLFCRLCIDIENYLWNNLKTVTKFFIELYVLKVIQSNQQGSSTCHDSKEIKRVLSNEKEKRKHYFGSL